MEQSSSGVLQISSLVCQYNEEDYGFGDRMKDFQFCLSIRSNFYFRILLGTAAVEISRNTP